MNNEVLRWALGGDCRLASPDSMEPSLQALVQRLATVLVRKYTLGELTVHIGLRSNEGTARPTWPLDAVATCRVLIPKHSWDAEVLIGLTRHCADCMEDDILHEFAHAYSWVRRLNKCRTQSDIARTVSQPMTQHDDLWGLCYAELYRECETAIYGRPLPGLE